LYAAKERRGHDEGGGFGGKFGMGKTGGRQRRIVDAIYVGPLCFVVIHAGIVAENLNGRHCMKVEWGFAFQFCRGQPLRPLQRICGSVPNPLSG